MKIGLYDILFIHLDPNVRSEIQKTRPCVVIPPNEMNQNLRTVAIATMASQSKQHPTPAEIKHGEKKGWIVIDRIQTIDKQRIIKNFGC